jgi:hypothetical protein
MTTYAVTLKNANNELAREYYRVAARSCGEAERKALGLARRNSYRKTGWYVGSIECEGALDG